MHFYWYLSQQICIESWLFVFLIRWSFEQELRNKNWFWLTRCQRKPLELSMICSYLLLFYWFNFNEYNIIIKSILHRSSVQEMARDDVAVCRHVPHLVPSSHMGCVSNVSAPVCTFVSTLPKYIIIHLCIMSLRSFPPYTF